MPWTFYNSNGQRLSSAATSINVLDIDGATALSGAVADADLFIVDDNASGANRKVTAATLKTYVNSHALEFIGTVEASNDATITVTGLDTAVYDHFEIQFAGITPISDNVVLQFRMGDSGGIDSGASDYSWAKTRYDENATESVTSDTSDEMIEIAEALGNQTTESYSGTLYINTGDLSSHTILYGLGAVKIFTGTISLFTCYGQRFSNLTLTQVQASISSGNVQTGRMTVWGRKHA